MLKFLSRPAVKLVERYLPDPYIFVLLLTLVAAVAAIAVERQTPLEVLRFWGDGFWNLLTFSMQMLLVLVTGFMLASSPPVKRQLARLAGKAGTPARAIVLVTLVSLAASWINWGFGLVVGALFAKELARQIRVDYRLLVASAYSGFVVWHAGLAGSIPLVIATEGHFTADQIQSYKTNGYLLGPRVLSDEQINILVQRIDDILGGRFREQGHAVVGFLAGEYGFVAGLTDGVARELVVGELGFLQRQYVHRRLFQPGLYVWQADIERVDVPGGDLHELFFSVDDKP